MELHSQVFINEFCRMLCTDIPSKEHFLILIQDAMLLSLKRLFLVDLPYFTIFLLSIMFYVKGSHDI